MSEQEKPMSAFHLVSEIGRTWNLCEAVALIAQRDALLVGQVREMGGAVLVPTSMLGEMKARIAVLEAQVAELAQESAGQLGQIDALDAVNAGLVEALGAALDRSITLDPFTLHTIDAALAKAREAKQP